MIQRALELQDDLYTVKSLNKSISDIWLTQNEWKKIKVSIYYILSDLLILQFINFLKFNLQELENFLSQFNIATIELSGQRYPTIAYARIVLLGLLVDFNNKREYDYILRRVFLAVRNKIKEYWDKLDEITHIAAFFDPRYKNIAYQGISKEEILTPIRNCFPISTSSSQANNRKKSVFAQRLSNFNQQQQQNINSDELIRYWESSEANDDIEPLSWWRAHSTEYPILSKMAQNYLSVQASSVPCEQLFSLAGNIVSKKRNRLDENTVRACLCLRSWMVEEIE